MKKIFFLLVLMMFMACSGSVEEGSSLPSTGVSVGKVSGIATIKNEIDNSGIEIALREEINGASSNVISYKTLTDKEGNYILANVQISTYTIDYKYKGKILKTIVGIEVKNNEITNVEKMEFDLLEQEELGEVNGVAIIKNEIDSSGIEVALREEINGASSNVISYKTLTDRDGNYVVSNIKTGTYTIDYIYNNEVQETIKGVIVKEGETLNIKNIVIDMNKGIYFGDLYITSDMTQSELDEIIEIRGNLKVSPDIKSVKLSNLKLIHGYIYLESNNVIERLELSSLEEIYSGFHSDSTAIKELKLANLKKVNMFRVTNANLSVFDVSSLEEISDMLSFHQVEIEYLNLNRLQKVGKMYFWSTWIGRLEVDSLKSFNKFIFDGKKSGKEVNISFENLIEMSSIDGDDFTGDFTISSINLSSLNLPNLVKVEEISFSDTEILGELNLNSLEQVETLSIRGGGVTSINLPSLYEVKNVFLNSLDNLVEFKSTKLKSVLGNIEIRDCNLLSLIDLPNLVNINQEFEFRHNSVLEKIDMPALTSIGSRIELYSLDKLSSVNLPSLESIGLNQSAYKSRIWIVQNLVQLELPKLSFLNGVLIEESSLIDISMPNLIKSSGDIEITRNKKNERINLPLLEEVEGNIKISRINNIDYDKYSGITAINLNNLERVDGSLMVNTKLSPEMKSLKLSNLTSIQSIRLYTGNLNDVYLDKIEKIGVYDYHSLWTTEGVKVHVNKIPKMEGLINNAEFVIMN